MYVAHQPEKGGKIWQVTVFSSYKGLTCQKNWPKRGRSRCFRLIKGSPARKTGQNVAGPDVFAFRRVHLLQKTPKLQEVEFQSGVRRPPDRKSTRLNSSHQI